jgi:purine-nucleoside phosphorylase
MYKESSAQDFRKKFGLPNDYVIDGFISYGAWNRNKHLCNIKESVSRSCSASSVEWKTLTGFLGFVDEFTVGSKRYWFTVQYGGALLSELTHLACLFGSKKNIHIGSCGGLKESLADTSVIIPSWTFGNESVTRIYGRNIIDNKHSSHTGLSQELYSLLVGKCNLNQGPLFTNQGMMGETQDDILSWSRAGYSGVEMETSTLFAVSNYFKVPAAALVYISNNQIKGQLTGDGSHMVQKKDREKIKELLYDTAIHVILK